jgi:DNA polymerase-3 subunit alpha
VPAPFVHLHLHTQYSLLDGAIKHNPLFERVKAANMPAVAQTDHGNLFGTVEFYEKARANGVKPIIGCEVYFAGGSRFDREKKQRAETGYDAINHLLILAMDARGYQNLMALVSKAYLEGFYYKPRIDWELLETYHQGLICTSGCLSAPVPRSIIANEPDTAWTMAEDFKRLFGDRYYLEVQRHGIPAQEIVNQELLKMHHDMGIPLVATNDAHYLEEHDHDDHDVLLCVGTAANVSDEKRFRFDGHGFYVKDGDEMREVFHDMPQAVEATLEIAERCDVEIPMGKYHMPEFQVPAGKSLDGVMEEQAWSGLRVKLGMDVDEPFVGDRKCYKERLEYELGVIKGMGFPGYFLIVADFINYAKANDIPVGPGRGSSAGSLVAYGMNITNVDPVEYDIIFERFLNPERISMPDIDVDFCMRGREQVIRYVADKYDGAVPEGDSLEGRYDQMKVAQIVTFGTLQAKAAIRDVGRVLGLSYGEVDRIAKMIPDVLGIKLEEAIAQSPELRSAMDSDGQIKRLLDTAKNLEGITRHASKHAAGVVVGTKPLIEMVPLYKDPKSGDVMTQYNMNCIEQIGLIKFDFLGLKTLTLMADAERMIRRKPGCAEFDVNAIPMDDPATYALLCRGDTEGVFQLESSGMTDLVLKLKPATFREIIPLVALYRPGPLQSGMVDDYVARKSGATKIEYLHPAIIDITKETLGVIVYQDQVLQIAQKMAGYSLGEADLLRRAMGKKKADVMQEQRERFISGSVANDIDGKEAGRVFDLIVEFAGYGFPKAHSTAYAYITYQTAYLKANHQAEYLASVLTIESSNHDRLSRYLAHVREKGIEILPPDVNHSDLDFGVVDGAIRFGFAGIKNVGAGAIEVILEARREGAFESLFDFADRVDARKVNRRVVESLVKCGAFDSLHPGRASVWASIDGALERAASMQRDRAIGQENLFGGLGDDGGLDVPKLVERTDWNERERLSFEKELIGFYVTGHPLSSVAPLLASFTDTTSLTVAGKAGREIRAGGLLTGLRETRTKRGLRMGFGVLEDLEGSFELVIFTETFEQHVGLLREAKDELTAAGERGPIPLIIHGTLEEGDPPKILVRDVTRLDIAEEKLAASLRVRVLAPDITRDRLLALKKLLGAHAGDCGVYLHITIPGESETILGVGGIRGVTPSAELCQEVDRLFGRPVAERAI